MIIAGNTDELRNSVKILGVILDCSLSFDSQIASICKSCNYHLRTLRHICPMLSSAYANQLACSIVATRLDYCNSLLFKTSAHNLRRLQRIQNNLARIVCNVPARIHALPLPY